MLKYFETFTLVLCTALQFCIKLERRCETIHHRPSIFGQVYDVHVFLTCLKEMPGSATLWNSYEARNKSHPYSPKPYTPIRDNIKYYMKTFQRRCVARQRDGQCMRTYFVFAWMFFFQGARGRRGDYQQTQKSLGELSRRMGVKWSTGLYHSISFFLIQNGGIFIDSLAFGDEAVDVIS